MTINTQINSPSANIFTETMTEAESDLLKSCMETSKSLLEFGAGKSTVLAATQPSIKCIYSVESSREFIEDYLNKIPVIQKAIKAQRITFHLIDIGKTSEWGYPENTEKKQLWPNYSSSIFSKANHMDLALIDGRFRVACTLNCILHLSKNCKIIIHDFFNRPQYFSILKYLDIEKRADTMAVFKIKNNINTQKLKRDIKKFQLLPDDKTALFRLREKVTLACESMISKLKKIALVILNLGKT